MTSDRTHDTSSRLRAYGAARGMMYGPRCRLLRTTGGFGPVRDALSLRVGYGPATVNNHALEIALIDGKGRATTGIAGRGWDEADIYRLLAGSAPT